MSFTVNFALHSVQVTSRCGGAIIGRGGSPGSGGRPPSGVGKGGSPGSGCRAASEIGKGGKGSSISATTEAGCGVGGANIVRRGGR